jgi:hypothetical protein
MTVLAVPPLAGLAEFRSGSITSIGLVQIEPDQTGTVQLVLPPAKHAGDATGDPRENLHSIIIEHKEYKDKRGDEPPSRRPSRF